MSITQRHIVIVTSEFPPQPGGIGNHAYNLALYLKQNEYSVTVITDQRSESGEEEKDFDQSLPFKVKRIRLYNWRFIMYLKRIFLTFNSFKKASQVIATGKFSLWNVAFCSLFFKRQTIAVIHGSEVNFKSTMNRKFTNASLLKFDRIVAVSKYTKSLITHLNKDVVVIPNGINIENWKLKQSPNFKLLGQPIITTVGRVSSRKGQLNVIKHLPELIKYFPEIHYHCVGIPTEAEAFLKIANNLNVEKYVTFHGSVDAETLKNTLSLTDVFVMLSIESKGDVEGFGIAILEANALGIPAIGAKGCGIEDAIKPQVSGILIEADNLMEFKAALEKILQNKIAYKTEAKTWAKAHDWSHIIKRYIDLFK